MLNALRHLIGNHEWKETLSSPKDLVLNALRHLIGNHEARVFHNWRIEECSTPCGI